MEQFYYLFRKVVNKKTELKHIGRSVDKPIHHEGQRRHEVLGRYGNRLNVVTLSEESKTLVWIS
jgi:hypothetical protein